LRKFLNWKKTCVLESESRVLEIGRTKLKCVLESESRVLEIGRTKL
jgi:hypothetical protein